MVSHNPIRLQDCGDAVPKDLRDLRACLGCCLILSNTQWNSKKIQQCPNCGTPSNETTSDFSGMISIIMPAQSWVARYNKMMDRMPGIYATKLHEEIEMDQGERKDVDMDEEEDDMNGFIVDDDAEDY